MKASARYEKEHWLIGRAHVDKLGKFNKGVMYPLFRQDLFDWTTEAKEWRQKIPEKRFVHFSAWLQKKNRHRKFRMDKRREIAGELRKLCKAEGKQIYSTVSETKAANAERTIRSLRKKIYRYVENYGYKHIHKLSQFVTTLNSGKICSIEGIPKLV